MKKKSEILSALRAHAPQILCAVLIAVLAVLMLFQRRQLTIGFLSIAAILALGIEKRAVLFDRAVSMLVIFFLACGFMFFN